MLVNSFVVLIYLSCMHFFNNGPAFLKSILSKLKSVRCAKLSIGYGGLMFSRNFTGIKSGESFDKE